MPPNILYFIHGIHSPDRLSQRFFIDKDDQVQDCFEDAIKMMPHELCRIAIDRLHHADLVDADITPQQRNQRMMAMKLLGDEMDRSCIKVCRNQCIAF